MLRSFGLFISLICGVANAVEVMPELNGTLESSCRANLSSPCATQYTPGTGVPSGANTGMLRIVGDYVTIQDLKIDDSAGTFYDMEGEFGILDNLDAEYAFFQLGYHAGGLGKNAIIKNSLFASWNWARYYYDGGATGHTIPSRGSGQGGILIRNHRSTFNGLGEANVLIQGNTFADYSDSGLNLSEGRSNMPTELINCLQSTHVVAADNISFDVAPFYSDNCAYAVWERNIHVAGAVEDGAAFSVTQEGYSVNGVSNEFLLYRNNIVFGSGTCAQSGDIEQGSIDNNFLNGDQHFFSNTCLGAASFGFDNRRASLSGQSAWQDGAALEVKGNLWFAPDAASTQYWTKDPSCRALYTSIDMDYNVYDNANTANAGSLDALCTGNSSTTADPELATTYANRGSFNLGNLPTVGDAEPGATSPVLGQGDPDLETETLSWLASDTFSSTVMTELLGNSPGACFTEANWLKKNACDAAGNTRDATSPDAGAVEYTP